MCYNYTIATKEKAMLLNQAQAEAIYTAACALNNIGAKQLTVNINGAGQRVILNEKRGVTVVFGYLEKQRREVYASQAAFAKAYNLN